MRKTKLYRGVRFGPQTLAAACARLEALLSEEQARGMRSELSVERGDERWEHDRDGEFLEDCRRAPTAYRLHKAAGRFTLSVDFRDLRSRVSISAPDREAIEGVFAVFEASQRRGRGEKRG